METLKALNHFDQPFSNETIMSPAHAERMTRVGALHFNYATDLIYIDIPKPEDFARRRLPLSFGHIFRVMFKEQAINESRIKNVAINYALLTLSFSTLSLEAAWDSPL